MESFSAKERMLFIRFVSGNLGLPAPGLKWDELIQVEFLSKKDKEDGGNDMVVAKTCFSKVDIPHFENEQELAKLIRMSIKFSGLITDSHEDIDQISQFL